MGKVSDADFAEMRDRLRARAVRLMTQLDGAAMYRAQIERDLVEAGGASQAGASERGEWGMLRVRHGQRRGCPVLQAVREGVAVRSNVRGAGCGVRGAVLGAWCLVLSALPASAQMPDPRAMHGQAIPAGELPAGSVTVRVVRESVGNNLPGVPVELHGAGDVRRATTGADGRAQFASVPPGSRVHADAVVDGERLESSTFEVPGAGGVRTILVAGLGLGAGGAHAEQRRQRPPAAVPAAGCPSATTPGLRSSSRTTRSPCSTCSRSSTPRARPPRRPRRWSSAARRGGRRLVARGRVAAGHA